MDDRPTPFAVFDFDGTLLAHDTMLHWQRWYLGRRRCRHEQIGLWMGALRSLFSGRFRTRLKQVWMYTCRRETPESMRAIVQEFTHDVLAPCFIPDVLRQLWLHHDVGDHIVIVTASPAPLVSALGDLLPPCSVMGTNLRLGRTGQRLPTLQGEDLRGDAKVRRLQSEGLLPLPPESFAYGNRKTDLPILQQADHPVAVSPDQHLRREAWRRAMPVLDPAWPPVGLGAGFRRAVWAVLPILKRPWPPAEPLRGSSRRRAWKRLWNDWARIVLFPSRRPAHRDARTRRFERSCAALGGCAPLVGLVLRQEILSSQGKFGEEDFYRNFGEGAPVAIPAPRLDALVMAVRQVPGHGRSLLSRAAHEARGHRRSHRLLNSDQGRFELVLLEPNPVDDAATMKVLPTFRRNDRVHRAVEGVTEEWTVRAPLLHDADRLRRLTRILGTALTGVEGVELLEGMEIDAAGRPGMVRPVHPSMPLSGMLAYLARTRRLQDPRSGGPDPAFAAMAALVARIGPPPQGTMIESRLARAARAAARAGIWIDFQCCDLRVRPTGAGEWILDIGDLAPAVELVPQAARLLLEPPESIADLGGVLASAGWRQSDLAVAGTRHAADLAALVGHPVVHATATGFAFRSWRPEHRLRTLLGEDYRNRSWPLPPTLRPIFRSLRWLRRAVTGLSVDASKETESFPIV